MKLGTIDKTAAIAWSPGVHTPLLALGTIAGAMDSDFSSQTELAFYEMTSSQFKKLGGLNVNAR
jgi:protein transport protein SEC31